MDMSSTIIQTFLCMMEAFRRVSWFIVKVPVYVQATVMNFGLLVINVIKNTTRSSDSMDFENL